MTATAAKGPSPAEVTRLARRATLNARRLQEAERRLLRPVRQARRYLTDVETALAGVSDEEYPVLLVVCGAREVLDALEALRALLVSR